MNAVPPPAGCHPPLQLTVHTRDCAQHGGVCVERPELERFLLHENIPREGCHGKLPEEFNGRSSRKRAFLLLQEDITRENLPWYNYPRTVLEKQVTCYNV